MNDPIPHNTNLIFLSKILVKGLPEVLSSSVPVNIYILVFFD